ncbi:MAG: ParA family protein [Christensenellales bacterium]
MEAALSGAAFDIQAGIVNHSENLNYIPANINLSTCDNQINAKYAREYVLHRVLKHLHGSYDYILIDCPPTLGMLTANALTTATHAIIPTQAQYYSILGMRTLIGNINEIQESVNSSLQISGVLMNMTDMRNNHTKHVVKEIRKEHGDSIGVFQTQIPRSVRAEESALWGQSVLELKKAKTVSDAYRAFSAELIKKFHTPKEKIASMTAL